MVQDIAILTMADQ